MIRRAFPGRGQKPGRNRRRAWATLGLCRIGITAGVLGGASSSSANNCNTHNNEPYPNGTCRDWAHWNDQSGNVAQVTIVDNTPAAWPVYASTINWDYLGHLNITYRTSCDGHVHCAEVNSDHFGAYTCHTNPGYAIFVKNDNGHFDSATRIRLNDDCNNNWGDHGQKVITCQEEGHVYGAGHEFEAAKDETCMATPSDLNYNIASWNATPRHHDFVELDDDIYDHND